MNSRAIAQRSIARQDNAPEETSLLWFDTSLNPAVLKTYNTDKSEWTPVASEAIATQDTPPEDTGILWVDTGSDSSPTLPVPKLYDDTVSEWRPISLLSETINGRVNGFDTYPDGKTDPFDEYITVESGTGPQITDTKALVGTKSLTFSESHGSGEYFDWELPTPWRPSEGQVYINETSSGGSGFYLMGNQGPIFGIMGDGSQIRFLSASGSEINSGISDDWINVNISNFDFVNDNFDVTVSRVSDGSELLSGNRGFSTPADNVEKFRFGSMSLEDQTPNGATTDTFHFDEVYFPR